MARTLLGTVRRAEARVEGSTVDVQLISFIHLELHSERVRR